MLLLIERYLGSDVGQPRVRKSYLAAPGGWTGGSARISGGEARAGSHEKIKLRFQILKVQSEIKNIGFRRTGGICNGTAAAAGKAIATPQWPLQSGPGCEQSFFC